MLHQNRMNCVVLVFRWCSGVFGPKFTSNKKKQNSSPARIGGEVSGVALRDVQRFCPRGSQSWDSKQNKKAG